MIVLACSPTYGCGKDTLGEILIESYNFERVSFADELKRIATEVFTWDGEKDVKGRDLLINVGMTARKYKPNFWIGKALEKTTLAIMAKKNVIITDCRFLNEQKAFNEYFSMETIITIGIERHKNGFEKEESQKEYYDMEKDFIINNTGTLIDFEKEVHAIFKGTSIYL